MCGLKSEKVKLVIGSINLMSNSPDYLYFQQLWLTKSKFSGFYLTSRMEKVVPFYTVNTCSEFVDRRLKSPGKVYSIFWLKLRE